MSLFRDPAEHAANHPQTWTVQRSGRRWQLCAAGVVLDTFDRKADAEAAARTEGPLARLYAKETRWYAGENVEGWKPYVPAPITARTIAGRRYHDDAEYLAAVTRRAAILARPAVAAIVDQARTLDDAQRAALHAAWLPHFRTFRRAQSDLWHRFVKAVGAPHWRDTFAAVEEIGRTTRAGLDPYEGDAWGATHAVEDAAKTVIVGEVLGLSDSEALVYVGPWLAVFATLPAGAVEHRAHPVTSDPFVSGWVSA